MEQDERRRRRNAVLGGVSLIFVCAIAVVVPTAVVLTRNDDTKTSNIGEKTKHTVEEEFAGEGLLETLVQHQGSNVFRIEVEIESSSSSDDDGDENEDLLLSDAYYSSSQANLSLTDSDDGAAELESTNSSSSNSSYPATASPTSSPVTASPSTLSPTVVPTDPPTSVATTTAPTEEDMLVAPRPQIAKRVDSYQVLEIIDHDVDAFTQGLTFDPQNSTIVYESTGLFGESDVRIVDIKTGEVLKMVETPSSVFGEGLAYFTEEGKGRLVHITWKSQRGFIFDAETLETLEEFEFFTERNEGWGITYNPRKDQFLVTDGSNYLHFWDRDSESFTETARIPVFLQVSEAFAPQPAFNLNEIEWDDATQTVLSNVWQTNLIVRIDPTTGRIVTQYDMSQLYTNRIPGANVLNGIAISPEGDLWVTGKKWPSMFKIAFIE